MRTLFIILAFVVGSVAGGLVVSLSEPDHAEAQPASPPPPGPDFAHQVGDVNCDQAINIGDAVYLLTALFIPGAPQGCVFQYNSLPDTGQTTCYDQIGTVVDCATGACSGQDGFHATGCPAAGRFIDNGDGTVTDTCTGLMWQQDTGFAGLAMSWCDALANCENLEFAGHTDWRLPNLRELQSIADYGTFSPGIDPVFGALSSWYWSSASYADSPDFAWFVSFFDGFVFYDYKGNERFVRAVRSGP